MSSKPSCQTRNSLQCTVCGKSFRNKRILNAHLVHTHQLKAPEPEPVSPEPRTKVSEMVYRVFCGPSEKGQGKPDGSVPQLFKCPKCSATFGQYQKMARHFASRHNVDKIRDQISRLSSLPEPALGFKEEKLNNGRSQPQEAPDASNLPRVKSNLYEALVNDHSKIKIPQKSIETISMRAPEETKGISKTRVTCSCKRRYQSWEYFERHIQPHHQALCHSFFFPEPKYFQMWKAELCKDTGLAYAIKPDENSRSNSSRSRTVWHCLHGTLTDVPYWCPSAIFVQRFDKALQVTLYAEHPGFKAPKPYTVSNAFQRYYLRDFSKALFQSWDRIDEAWALDAVCNHIRGITNRAVEKLAGLDADHLKIIYTKLFEIIATINHHTYENKEKPTAEDSKTKRRTLHSDGIPTADCEEIFSNTVEKQSRKVIDRIVWETPLPGDVSLKLGDPFTLAEVDIEELLTTAAKPKQNGKASSLELATDSPKDPGSSYVDTFKDFLVKGAGPPLLGSVIKGAPRTKRIDSASIIALEDEAQKCQAARHGRAYRRAIYLPSHVKPTEPESQPSLNPPTSAEATTKITSNTEATIHTVYPLPSNAIRYPPVLPKVKPTKTVGEVAATINRPSVEVIDAIADSSRRGRPRRKRKIYVPELIVDPGLNFVSDVSASVETIIVEDSETPGQPRSKRRQLSTPVPIETSETESVDSEGESSLPEVKPELEDTVSDVASEPEQTLISDVKSELDPDEITIEETVVGRLEDYEVMEQDDDCNILIFKI